MSHKNSKRSKRRGRRFHRQSTPGSTAGIVAVDQNAPPSHVTVTSYGKAEFECIEAANIEQIKMLRQRPQNVVWVHVCGLGGGEIILQLGKEFSLHRLALEDVVNVHQQVKVEDYTCNLFIVSRMLLETGKSHTQQLGIFVGDDFVISFEEQPSQMVKLIKRRVNEDVSQIRQNGPDFLVYYILDAILDQYFPLLEKFGERLDDLEDQITDRSPPELVRQIHEVRVELRSVRRIIWQHREAINNLMRNNNSLIGDTTRLFLRDCHDHTIQLVELLEIYHETCSDLRDVYLSSMSNRMNEIMMVLTVIATVFMPLSFIAGLYGMNFNTQLSPLNMPELNWYFGYPFALALMVSVVTGQLLFFRHRGWIWRSK